MEMSSKWFKQSGKKKVNALYGLHLEIKKKCAPFEAVSLGILLVIHHGDKCSTNGTSVNIFRPRIWIISSDQEMHPIAELYPVRTSTDRLMPFTILFNDFFPAGREFSLHEWPESFKGRGSEAESRGKLRVRQTLMISKARQAYVCVHGDAIAWRVLQRKWKRNYFRWKCEQFLNHYTAQVMGKRTLLSTWPLQKWRVVLNKAMNLWLPPQKIRGISWLSGKISARQEGLHSTEPVTCLFEQ
jgi:hypothetical protein